MAYTPLDLRASAWASALADARARMRPLFAQARVADCAASFIEAALAGDGRRTGWARAARAGDCGPWRQQALLGRHRWCPDALRRIVREYVIDHIGTDDAVLTLGETRFLKQGHRSCGVARQSAGGRQRLANCQVAVVATYASPAGCALIDCDLHLPETWASDPARMAAAGVPEERSAPMSRAQLAAHMLDRTLSGGLPASFITAGAEFEAALAPLARAAHKNLLVAIDGAAPVGSPLGRPHIHGSAADIARRLAFSAWHRFPASAEYQPEEWAGCELAIPERDAVPLHRRRSLLVRRMPLGGHPMFYRCEHEAAATLDRLVAAVRRSGEFARIVQVAGGAHGFDHNETRSWQGWHRHVGLVMMALAVKAAVLRTDGDTPAAAATQRVTTPKAGP